MIYDNDIDYKIKKNRTPKGDGNFNSLLTFPLTATLKKNRTPKGDGNYHTQTS